MTNDIKEGYRNRLKNKLFGLLCEFEKKGEWESFLDAILIELQGIPEDEQTINYLYGDAYLNLSKSNPKYLEEAKHYLIEATNPKDTNLYSKVLADLGKVDLMNQDYGLAIHKGEKIIRENELP